MNEEFQKKEVNTLTMEVISKGIYKETAEFGFSTQDYIKLVNALLELTIHHKTNGKNNKEETAGPELKELKLLWLENTCRLDFLIRKKILQY